MCGRFCLKLDKLEDLRTYLEEATELALEGWRPRYNAAPSQLLPVVIDRGAGLAIQPMQWGFVPRWAKSLDAKMAKPINARSEGIEERPMFKNAFSRTRCLVPMSGFFEWKVEGAKNKQPYYIAGGEGKTLFAAGIWERWTSPDKTQTIETFAVLTEAAQGPMTDFHDRMPIFLTDKQDQRDWMAPTTPVERVQAIVAKHPLVEFEIKKVSKAVNSPRNDFPEVLLESTGTEGGGGDPKLF